MQVNIQKWLEISAQVKILGQQIYESSSHYDRKARRIIPPLFPLSECDRETILKNITDLLAESDSYLNPRKRIPSFVKK